MSIQKKTLSALLLVSLTACSGGSSGSSTTAQPTPNSTNAGTVNTPTVVNVSQPTPHSSKKAGEQSPNAEESKKAEEAEKARLAEERKKAEEAEKARLAEERKKAEEAEKTRQAEQRTALLRENGMSYGLSGEALEKFVAKDILVISEDTRIAQAELAMELLSEAAPRNRYTRLQNYFDKGNNGAATVRDVLKYSATTAVLDKYDGLEYVTKSGLRTLKEELPTLGQVRYLGNAFRDIDSGALSYDVDFAAKTGSGVIEGLGSAAYHLKEGKIDGTKITSQATHSGDDTKRGTYSVEFFGPKAEEIGGEMSIDNKKFGLSGTKRDR